MSNYGHPVSMQPSLDRVSCGALHGVHCVVDFGDREPRAAYLALYAATVHEHDALRKVHKFLDVRADNQDCCTARCRVDDNPPDLCPGSDIDTLCWLIE